MADLNGKIKTKQQMPYFHKKSGNKECVYKKSDGSKVGCTSGSVKKYLGALYANADESIDFLENDTKHKPDIFTHTIYRSPTEQELKDVHDADLTADEIKQGFGYTMIGRGIASDENKAMIIDAISRLVKMYPGIPKYKEALTKAKEMKGRHITAESVMKNKPENADLKMLIREIVKDVMSENC